VNKIIEEDFRYIYSILPLWYREEIKNKKILITGAAGMLASYFVLFLLYSGAIVYGMVRNIDYANKLYYNNMNLYLIEHDVKLPFPDDIKNIDYVFHMASKASKKAYESDAIDITTTNYMGMYNCLKFAEEDKCKKVIYISAGEIYGFLEENNLPLKESLYGGIDPLSIRACYGESKKAAENLCYIYSKQRGVNTSIGRLFHTYGPGLRENDDRIFSKVILGMLCKKDIVINNNGNDTRGFLYLSDMVTGFMKILFNGCQGDAYNIGSSIEVSIKEFVYAALKACPCKGSNIIINSEGDDSPMSRIFPDTTKLEGLGWSQTVPLEKSLDKTFAYHMEGLI
jgi:nucleoside-diphosphate-sugar epimerase